MLQFPFILGLCATLFLQEPAPSPSETEVKAITERYPASSALDEGVSPVALERLDQLIGKLVEEEAIVGGELLVIKNGSALLNKAYGWRDREAEERMEPGGVFCVRSMTKPLVGACIWMLIDEGALKIDDKAAQFIPAFDVDGLNEITIGQLLTHTGGLPMSKILGASLSSLESIQQVAGLISPEDLVGAPGEKFHYSDQGTDTLTAIVEVVSGIPVADFVTQRLLKPLGMNNSACLLEKGSDLQARSHPLYIGSAGEWQRFWGPEKDPLFPVFLGSQGLYSTTRDYAQFMEMWMNRGRVGKQRLLPSRYVRRALTPGPEPMSAGTGFPGLRVEYGSLMQLWTGIEEATAAGQEAKRKVRAFGHTGSDGTHAWVFPRQKAMVMFFTQSRNTSVGLRVEEVLGEIFLGAKFNPNEVAPPFDPYLGYYWEGEGDQYRAIIRDGEDMALEILGKAVVPLNYAGGDRWKFRQNPSVVIEFDRNEAGDVTGYHIGEHQEFRFEPAPELPTADQVVAMVMQAHRMDLVESVGPVQISSRIEMPKLGLEGKAELTFAWPNRFRLNAAMGEETEQVAWDGTRLGSKTSANPLEIVEGHRRDLVITDTPIARFGDWRKWNDSLRVIQKIDRGKLVYLVRAGDTSAPVRTYWVDAEKGFVVRVQGMTHLPSLGRIGQVQSFGNFREVSGMWLPHEYRTELANPLIGEIISKVQKIEVGVDAPAELFQLTD